MNWIAWTICNFIWYVALYLEFDDPAFTVPNWIDLFIYIWYYATEITFVLLLLNLKRLEIYLNPANNTPEKINRGIRCLNLSRLAYMVVAAIINTCLYYTNYGRLLDELYTKSNTAFVTFIIVNIVAFMMFVTVHLYMFASLLRILDLLRL